MYRFQTILILALMWLLSACAGKPEPDSDSGSDYPTVETFVMIDNCMACMKSDPMMAHRMLDTITDAGLMTRQRCDYFHAMVMFGGESLADSALAICDRLLDAGSFGDDRFLEEELCVLASNITFGANNHLSTLKYANRGIALCHGDERMRGDEAMLMARVGVAEQELGCIEQARETFDRACQLLKGTATFSDLVALITLQKRQMGLYCEMRDYAAMIRTAHEVEQLVSRFAHDPSFVAVRPETMQQPGSATQDFADFYLSQMYAHLARAYRLRIVHGQADDVRAETDSVRTYMHRLLHNEAAENSQALVNSLPEMQFVGLKSDFDRVRPLAEEVYHGDSLVHEYVEYLSLLATDAASSHDLLASNCYLRRALAVSDSISRHEMMRILSEQMSIYMVQEQKLARQDAEYLLEQQRLMIRLLLVALLVVVGAGVSIGLLLRNNQRKKHILETTQQNLVVTKEEVKKLYQQLEVTRTERTADHMHELYERIEAIMAGQELYLDADLDILKLAEAACSSRSVVSNCINSQTGKSFRQWLAEYRLTLFEKMLRQNPDASIDELSAQCGYKDTSTFRRQFKEKYGMTALKYRNLLLKPEGSS